MKKSQVKNVALIATALTIPAFGAHAAPAKPAAKKPAAKPAAKKPAAKPAVKKAAVPAGYTVAKFDYPEATYTGTPRQVKNTTAPVWKMRPDVYLPKGAVNLAKGKPVTSSDDAPIIGELKMITDGEKEGTEGHWVELGPNTQWVQIDLGQPSTLNGVLMWHYFGESRVYRDVIVQISNDPDFIEGVETVFNNDNDSSSGKGVGKDLEFYESRFGHWVPVAGKKARYVRLYSKGNTSDPVNHYIEVEVYGQPK
jgi:hypothetical protein